jgi:hypothetical protein
MTPEIVNQFNEVLVASSPLLIAVAMTVFGRVLKMIPWFPDTLIPLGLSLSGSVGYMGLEGWTYRNGILGFVIGGMAAVGANQIWRQLVNSTSTTAEPEQPKPS